MFRPGLVSVTFRKLSPRKIVQLAVQAGLAGIEWGGDIHVPTGNIQAAHEVRSLTRDAGLTSAAYGSYYRMGSEHADVFPRVIETAAALETTLIRVWAGNRASAETDDTARQKIVEDGCRIAQLAEDAGMRIACEWHAGTLTDTHHSAASLLAAIDHPAFQTYWQPNRFMSTEDCLRDLEVALPCLAGLHVFSWDVKTGDRLPLADHSVAWKQYLLAARTSALPGAFALLEFVKDDDPEQLVEDAITLRGWLSQS